MNEQDLTRAIWHKSRYSNGQANCVEVAHNLPGIVLVRDSKAPHDGVLTVSPDAWKTFIQALAHGGE